MQKNGGIFAMKVDYAIKWKSIAILVSVLQF